MEQTLLAPLTFLSQSQTKNLFCQWTEENGGDPIQKENLKDILVKDTWMVQQTQYDNKWGGKSRCWLSGERINFNLQNWMFRHQTMCDHVSHSCRAVLWKKEKRVTQRRRLQSDRWAPHLVMQFGYKYVARTCSFIHCLYFPVYTCCFFLLVLRATLSDPFFVCPFLFFWIIFIIKYFFFFSLSSRISVV